MKANAISLSLSLLSAASAPPASAVAAFTLSASSPVSRRTSRGIVENRAARVSARAGLADSDDVQRGQRPEDERRRRAILGGAASSIPLLFGNNNPSWRAAAAADVDGPVADFPMRRLRLPKGGMGREYIIIQLYIGEQGPFDFMVDSGLTTELITPHLQQALNLYKPSGITKQGLSAGEVSQTQSLVDLDDVSLCCSSGQSSRFPLPGTLHAIVTDFPQEHMDPAHDPVEGMIGMEVLEQFDVDFDFPAGRLRLWKPHTVESVAKKAGMATVEAVVVNETRLLGFRIVSPSARRDASGAGVIAQPFLGAVDCGASFSVVNWSAAQLLGLPPQGDDAYKKNPSVAGMGVDGRPQILPTSNVALSYCGKATQADGNSMAFEAPPDSWKPWRPVSLAVGDLPVFSQLLGDGRTPYRGPAGIIGLDILSQRRVILETDVAGRRRRIFIDND